MGVNPYRVNIIGLSNKPHSFHFDLDDDFFVRYGQELISGGQLGADVELDKHETFINASFTITGKLKLVCDRSLEPFDYPVNVKQQMVFKYGEEEQELANDVTVITHQTEALDLGQLMYEFTSLQVPMRKLHPRFRDEEAGQEGEIIYSSSTEQGSSSDEEPIDPRWEKLKKLK